MTLGQSPPPMCLCGHDFHTGPCDGVVRLADVLGSHIVAHNPPPDRPCRCPDGELDGDL